MTGTAIVTIGNRQWIVSLTTTTQELVTGLGGLPSIPAGTGMLFDMGVEQIVTVTTEAMLFPIDIVFISSTLMVTEVALGVSPGNLVTSSQAARYFLEVNANEAAGLESGDPVTIQVYQAAGTQNPIAAFIPQFVNVMSVVVVFGFMWSVVKGMVKPMLPRSNPCPACPERHWCPVKDAGFCPGNPGSPVRFVGVGAPPGRVPVEERRRRGLPPGTRIELITPEEEARIRELRGQGLEYHQIAERMGRSTSTVWRTINRGHPALRRAITPQRLQEVMGLRRLGLTLEEIGKRLGLNKTMVLYLLRRAGERIDLTEETERLNRALWAVSGGLGPPATPLKLSTMASQLQELADNAALLLEIVSQEAPLDYRFDLGWIHSRALLAEEMLRNGVWCFEEREREIRPRVSERLSVCAEAARAIARGIIENWEGYETRATAVIFEIEGMVTEAERGPVAPSG